MTEENWNVAAAQLVDALAIEHDIQTLHSPKHLQSALAGHNLSLQRVDIVKGILPSAETLLGGVLVSHDKKTCLAFMSDTKTTTTIGKEGVPSQLLTESMLRHYAEAWVISPLETHIEGVAPFLRRYGGQFFDIIIASFLINLFALAYPLFSSFVYDKILGNGITETLWALAIALFIIMGIEFCVRTIRTNSVERFAVATEMDIDDSFFRKLMNMSVNNLPNTGTLLEKYKQLLSCRDFLSSSYLLSMADIPFLALYLATIAIVGGPMVFISALGGCVMVACNALFIRPVLDYDSQAKRGGEKRFGLISDVLTAREVIIGKAFHQELLRKLRRAGLETAQASSKARYWKVMGMSVSNTLSYLSFVAVLVAGVYMMESHQITSGGLLAVSMLTSRAMSVTSSISTLLMRYREFLSSVKEMNAAFSGTRIAAAPPSGRLNGTVRIDNLSCTLQKGQKAILEKINLNFSAGEIIGLAGSPGAGKTTLLRLVAGVLTPDSGKILIDDIPADRLSQADTQNSIGYKPQDLCLLEGTIGDNIQAGRQPLSSAERQELLISSGLEAAFRDSGLHWESPVGPRGIKLSGGQRQLVSLARAMAYTPTLLLLDEPTNGLDANLEMYIAQQIKQLKGKCTVVVSTHSHSILSICDRIVVIGQSKILADGPREKVLMPTTATKAS